MSLTQSLQRCHDCAAHPDDTGALLCSEARQLLRAHRAGRHAWFVVSSFCGRSPLFWLTLMMVSFVACAVNGYDRMGFEFSQPHLRAQTEQDMLKGTKVVCGCMCVPDRGNPFTTVINGAVTKEGAVQVCLIVRRCQLVTFTHHDNTVHTEQCGSVPALV